MTRVLKEYSKRDLERIVEHAVKKQLAAEAAYQELRRRVWGIRILCGLAGIGGLGLLIR